MKPFPAPTRPGFWWAKLRHPSRMPDGEDWASPDFEPVEVIDNNGDGDEALGVFVPGIQPMQWVPDFVWGPEIPALADDPPGRAEHMSLTTLPIAMDGRQWNVCECCGDTFCTDGDFDGIALTIEIRTDDEARAVAAALVDQTTTPIGGPVPPIADGTET